MANLASNNARQIYNQIPGLNIYQNDDAGLQLNIGGRGLNPNRLQILILDKIIMILVPDALGYPESYYTPPAEGLGRDPDNKRCCISSVWNSVWWSN
jgi:Fe(3+) dicitrate transport protein